MPEDIKLHFEGPFSFLPVKGHEWLAPDHHSDQRVAHKGGVYLWVVDTPDGYLVNYVGSTACFEDRIRQHLDYFITGRYWVYDYKSLAEGNKRLDTAYNPRQWQETFGTWDKFIAFQAKIYSFLEHVYVLLAPIDLTVLSISGISLTEIEGSLINRLRNCHLEKAKDFIDNERTPACKIKFPVVKCSRRILGLMEEDEDHLAEVRPDGRIPNY